MAITLVNKLGTANGTSTTTSVALTLANAVSSGDTVIVATSWGASNGGTLSVTDSRGNTYTKAVSTALGGTNSIMVSVFFSNLTTGLQVGDAITFHTTSSVNGVTVGAYDFSGLQVSPLDQTAATSGTNTSANPSSGSTATTTAASELLFGVLCSSIGSATAGTGFTSLDTNTVVSGHDFYTEYEVVSATGTYAATWTAASSTYNAAIATFKGATGSAPGNTVAPAVTGTSHVGQVLTTSNGTWTDDGSPTFTYQWQRDNSGGGTYSNITSATSSTYTLVDADDGCQVRCVVTDSTPDGNASANSNALAVTYAAPTNTVAPLVTGTASVGSVLSCDTGTWTT